MFSSSIAFYSISISSFLFSICLIITIKSAFTERRTKLLKRLQSVHIIKHNHEDELQKPFLERTIGELAKRLATLVGQITPQRLIREIETKLAKAGSAYNISAIDLLTVQAIIGATIFILIWFGISSFNLKLETIITIAIPLALLATYLPVFILATKVTEFQKELRKRLPDVVDLLVISVEAGLGFDLALQKVVERFPGGVAKEFKKVQKEIQLGRSRKEALKNMAERIDMPEISTLFSAIIQSEQLGVGLGKVLRLQANLIREKRQQSIEEKAMKTPIKILLPLVFFIFPCIFIIILGPAILNIIKTLGN